MKRDCFISLKEETCCDFFVSQKRKKVWNIEIDLMIKFDTVCKNNGLKYFLIGGAAIGVERHRGFIPWDDDIDIGMIREDFQRFLKVANEELSKTCCIQYGVEKKEDKSLFCRLRDMDSTAITKRQIQQNCNHGIFIEIYPFDKIPENRLIARCQIILSSLLKMTIENRFLYDNNNFFVHLFGLICKPIPINILFKVWNRVCSFFNNYNCKYVNTVSMPIYAKDGSCKFLYEDVKETEYKPFECMEVQVAKENVRILTNSFGDFMKLPSFEERGTHHNAVVYYDPDRSYKEVLNTDIPRRYFNGEYELGYL